jgi:hypothetical protein
MLWEALAVLLVIWVLFLAVALFYFAHEIDGGWGRWPKIVSDRFASERRAQALMRAMLAPDEYQQLRRQGYIEVQSPTFPGRVYRVPGAGGLVRVYEAGHAIMDLCLQPLEPLPDGDLVVLHKLMIEGNEHEYLAKANHFAPGVITLRVGYL